MSQHASAAATIPGTPGGGSAVPVHGARDVKRVSHEMTVSDRIYLVETLRGLGVTFRHFFANLGRLLVGRPIETVPYPDARRAYPVRFRAMHRLLKRDDGTPRCVACYLCATACPAHCIRIVAAERTGSTEKTPAVFEIDELRCVDCGLCVEACPCDAIRMDTGIHPAPATARAPTLFSRDQLLALSGREDGAVPASARTAERQSVTP
ncbi:MAG: NADH-quinone oxidoreductase subunit I [Deltaproteobacteria bacterium]|nr:NADH-quinone oxidoreductase subunit I [Deltaproteobacteria bacterium]